MLLELLERRPNEDSRNVVTTCEDGIRSFTFAGVAFGVAAGFDAPEFHCGFDEAT